MATLVDLTNVSGENNGEGGKSGCEYQKQSWESGYNAAGHTVENANDRQNS